MSWVKLADELEAVLGKIQAEQRATPSARVRNGIRQADWLVDVLRNEAGVVATEHEREAAKAAPRYDSFQIESTNRLIASGALPPGSTPADFIALQERNASHMREVAKKGSVTQQMATTSRLRTE